MSEARVIVLAQRPKDSIVIGQTFATKTVPMPTADNVQDGQVLVEVIYLAMEGGMRGWLDDSRSYIAPVQIGEVMRGYGICRVIASKTTSHPVGLIVTGRIGWREYAVVDATEVQPIQIPKGGKTTDALGILGIVGLTAYFGMIDVAKVKDGDVVVVSGAAGATGSIAGQIAKLKGAKKVVGIAGSDEKCKWLKDIGYDEALNYKDPDYANNFRAATEGFIDVFFDTAGGETLDLALERAKPHSRFAIYGGTSQYNSAHPQGPKNFFNVISMRINMQGFYVLDYAERFHEARRDLSIWLSEGKIQRKETIIKGGLAMAENALASMYTGINTGKLLVEVKPEAASSGGGESA